MSSSTDAPSAPTGPIDTDRLGDSDTNSELDSPLVIGWREWVALPLLGLPAIKAKIDTGARTSAIHAFDIERFKSDAGEDYVAFSVQPVQRDTAIIKRCEAPLIDIRSVTDSGGHKADRYFIQTDVQIGTHVRSIEMTLTQRNDMLFRMLLGRTAMVPNIQVDPSRSFSLGRMSARTLYADIPTGVVT